MKTATRPEEQSSRAHGQHIITSSRTVSMSSREIAELTGKAHDNVLRDIRGLMKKGVLKTEETLYTHLQNGQQYPEFLLNKRDTLVLVSGYDVHLRAKIIDRWIELESQQAPRIPQTFGEALRLAADQYDQRMLLTAKVKEQAIKIDALQNLFKEGMSPVQFCKGLNGVNVMQICRYLKSRDWLFNESKTGTRWRVASYARDLYMTEHQQQITPHGKEPFIHHTPILLRKGAERLFELYLKGELPMKKTWDGQFTHDKALAAQLGQQQEGGTAE